MNYLGHSFLSFNHANLLVGNLIGDFVKGNKDVLEYPEAIQKGIRLHRKIDNYTDTHMAITLAKNIFKPFYHLYAGPIVDVIWDYYLANDPRFFQNEKELLSFSLSQYQMVNEYKNMLPQNFQNIFQNMETQNWLYNYRTIKGIEKALMGLSNKAKYMENSNLAYQLFIQHFYELNQRYYEFIDDIVNFVKNEIEKDDLLVN
jgi:acyl carrier protein phosphodiesterase